MPGQTPNVSILKAIDEVINALNDLASNFQPAPPDLTTIETNIAALTEAIGGLTLTCAPVINVQSATPVINLSCPPPVINVTAGGGISCTGTGIKLEDPPVSETDPPPPGSEPDPNITDRKCRAANKIYDEIYGLVDKLKIQDADTLTAIGITGAASLIGALLGTSAFPLVGTAVGAVFGAIVGIVLALTTGTALDLDDIQAVLTNKHQELVCALYSASNTTQAKDDFIAVLQDGGLNSVEALAFMQYFLYADVLKVLFQSTNDSETILADYQGSVGCSGCEEQQQTFNGWFIPLHSQAIDLEYIILNDTHNGSINPGQEITIGQFTDDLPTPLQVYKTNGNDPNTVNSYGGVKTVLELISPTFISQGDATITFTIAGGGDGSPNADAQWHFYTYSDGVWTGSLGNYGNGTHSVFVPISATQAAITYVAPFTWTSPLPQVTDIQYTNLTVNWP